MSEHFKLFGFKGFHQKSASNINNCSQQARFLINTSDLHTHKHIDASLHGNTHELLSSQLRRYTTGSKSAFFYHLLCSEGKMSTHGFSLAYRKCPERTNCLWSLNVMQHYVHMLMIQYLLPFVCYFTVKKCKQQLQSQLVCFRYRPHTSLSKSAFRCFPLSNFEYV